MATAFVAHPYGYPVIGWESDIRNLKAVQAEAFFRANYTPDRAVGVLVGDLDVEATRKLLRETFGKIPARAPGAIQPRILPEPPQEGERRATLRLAATPTLLLGWHKPAAPDPADLTAELLAEVLTGGRSALWFEELVKRRQLAAEIETFTGPGDAQPNLFMAYAAPRGGVTLDELERAVREAVGQLRAAPVDPAALESAKKRRRAGLIRSLQDNRGLAFGLAETTQLTGDPHYLERRLRQLEGLTAADLQRFAVKYMTDDNLTVGRLEPPAGE
jgi:predicted Zn-dependent peptidase